MKLLLDSPDLDLLAVDDVASLENLAYLLRYDTAYGRYAHQVRADVDALVIDDRRIPVFGERGPRLRHGKSCMSTSCGNAPACSRTTRT
jgi:glyceraldehyde 3-phosphate dehydrogenase